MTPNEALAHAVATHTDKLNLNGVVSEMILTLEAYGFAIVPVEATDEMVTAALDRPEAHSRTEEPMYKSIYRAMVKAAQESE